MSEFSGHSVSESNRPIVPLQAWISSVFTYNGSMIKYALIVFIVLVHRTCYLLSITPELYINILHQDLAQVLLHNLPYSNFEDKTFDVAIWMRSRVSSPTNTWELKATTSNFTLGDRFMPSFCSCHMNIAWNSDYAFDLRAVLRVDSSESHLKQTVPLLNGVFPSMADEVHHKPSTDKEDFYTIDIWENPSDEVMHGRAQELAVLLRNFLTYAESSTETIHNVRKGFSGENFQRFLNAIGTIPRTKYLEVGIYNGSSLTTILGNNNDLDAVAIDIWDASGVWDTSSAAAAMKTAVISQVASNHNKTGRVHIIHDSCWNIRSNTIKSLLQGPANVYFYDAGHSVFDHFLSLGHFLAAMDNVFIFLVDDWNWNNVRKPTLAALQLYQLEIVMKIEVTTLISARMFDSKIIGSWHNGMAAFILRKS